MARARRRRQKGRGEVFKRPTGWAVRWREGGERRVRAGFATREDAQKVLEKVLGEIAQGRAVMPPNMRGVATRAARAGPFLDPTKKTPRSSAEDRYRWRKHLFPPFGRMKPLDV